jgi:glycolate oxidase subunit GlcD
MDKLVQKLIDIVGEENVSFSKADTELYSYDASLAKGTPAAVVFPANTHETSQVVRNLNGANVTFVPRGFGTNLSGGTILARGGVVICMTRLNRILGLYPERRYAVVQPGVTNLELQQALEPLGFFYAPDPASQKVSTIGGNIAENSGGPRCLKYGVTTNHVLGMEVVVPNGEVVNIGGPALDPPGYDLRGAIIGSEGTLALATEITVRILPKAEAIKTMLAIYNDIADAAQSVSAIISAGIVPTTLEMMDNPIINAVEDSYTCGYPRDAAAVLIIEVEGVPLDIADQTQRMGQLCMQNGCREIKAARDEGDRNRLWEGRRGAFGAIARLAPNYLVNDCTVPRTKLPQALAQVEAIVKKYQFNHGNVFHAGDGNLHPLILFDSRNEQQLHLVEKAGREIMQACVDLGGTISGEHGIGREKLEAMRMIFSENDFDAQRMLKKAFDPKNIMNPGKVIPEPINDDSAKNVSVFDQKSLAPSNTVHAKHLKEIRSEIQLAIDNGHALLPGGFGNQREYGNFSDIPTKLLESGGLGEIIDHDPPNQVVTAGSGMPLITLQNHLKPHHQWLALRPALFQQKRSLGGIAALGACGPERLHYGAPRDLILGLKYISAKGHLIGTGGRVVKNVAGYDMTRLLIGSAGTLGFITEITFRVAMLPERCAALTAKGSLAACALAARNIIKSDLLPVFIVCAGRHPDLSDDLPSWEICVGFEGFSNTVAHQLDKCVRLIEASELTSAGQNDYPVYLGSHTDFYEKIALNPFVLRIGLPLDQVAAMVNEFSALLEFQTLMMDMGCGNILAGMEHMKDSQWAKICELTIKHGGHLRLEKAPSEFKKHHDVFGNACPHWKVSHRIKAALDPCNLFSPGRLPGRI